jgi:outer membrane murein-binding lipoprotein Lpp
MSSGSFPTFDKPVNRCHTRPGLFQSTTRGCFQVGTRSKRPRRSTPRTWADPKAARAARRSARRKRAWRWGGLAGTLAIATVLTGTLLLAGRTSSRAAQDHRTIDRKIARLLAGIPQQGRTLGWQTAPVTLQVFADLQDIDSRRWVLAFLPRIIKELVRPGILKIEYRSFKTNTLDPKTFVKQQTAAIAAGAQNKLWNYIETFYHEQGREYTPYATENYIDGIASQIPGLNIAQWHQDRNDGRRSEQVAADDQAGRAHGIHTTPSYRLGHTGDPLKNITGSQAITFPRQTHPTSWANAEDLATAINQIH